MSEKDKLWEKVEKDFPCDPALQKVHYARLKIHEQTKGMSDQEFGFLFFSEIFVGENRMI